MSDQRPPARRRGKLLPPPKGAQETNQIARDAILGSRFSDTGGEPPTAETSPPASNAGPHDSEVRTHASYTAHTPGRQRRGEPEGMTRRTYYLPKSTADALDAAVARLRAATGGRATKHEALAAILAAGVDQADAAAEALRSAMLRDLQDGGRA